MENQEIDNEIENNEPVVENTTGVVSESILEELKVEAEPIVTEEPVKEKHPGGRPTSYSEEMLEKTKQYILSCEEEHEVRFKPVLTKDGKVMDEPYIHYNPKIPTIEGLAYELKVNKTTIYEWENKFEEFSNVIDELRNKQASQLVNKGLSGQYNSTIAKVLLTKHGYREGADLTTNDKDLPQAILNGLSNNNSDKKDSKSN